MIPDGQLNGDIRANLAVTAQEARQGTTRILNVPGNRQVNVTVPANAYNGQELRLPGQGAQRPDGTLGDLILTISITPAYSAAENAYSNYGDSSNSATEYIPPPPPPPLRSEQRYANPATPTYYGPPSSNIIGQTVPPPQKKRSPVLPILLVLLILVVAVVGIVIFATIKGSSGQTNNLSAQQMTATAQAAATLTPGATQTPAANTPTPSVTTVEGIYAQATNGTPDVSDPLTDQDTNNWYINSTDIGTCAFSGGAYHATVVKTGYFKPCLEQANNYDNFALQVQMNIIKGDRGGLIFREDSTDTKRYLFRIDQAGSFHIYVYTGNASADARSLKEGGSAAIHTGTNQTNLLTVVARGADIYFYANKQFIASIHDTTYTTGTLGFFAEDNTNQTEVVFSNAQIWKH